MSAPVETASLRLITIPISHYCDKARWALEHSGHAYVEDAHLQGFHYFATGRRRAGAFVPVLLRNKDFISGSAPICRWADAHRKPGRSSLYPEAVRQDIESFEISLDEGLGVPSRLLMYHYTLQNTAPFVRYLTTGIPALQRWLAPIAIKPAGQFIRRRLGVDAEAAARADAQCFRMLDDVAERLGDRPYLFEDRFTAADLTFAALATPLVVPEPYGVPLPKLEELPTPYAQVVKRARAHPAGQYALRMYERERRL